MEETVPELLGYQLHANVTSRGIVAPASNPAEPDAIIRKIGIFIMIPKVKIEPPNRLPNRIIYLASTFPEISEHANLPRIIPIQKADTAKPDMMASEFRNFSIYMGSHDDTPDWCPEYMNIIRHRTNILGLVSNLR